MNKYLIRYIKAVKLIKNCKHSFVLQKIKIRKNHKIILKHLDIINTFILL